MRIVSLLPSATEIVYLLGLGDHLTGVSHECDYPPAAVGKRKIIAPAFETSGLTSQEIDASVRAFLGRNEGIYRIDFEALKAADPDLIVTQDLCDVCALPAEAVTAAIAALPRQPKMVSLKPERLHEVLADIRRVGEAAGRGGEAGRLVAELTERITTVGKLTARLNHRPRVLCIEWFDPLYVGGHWIPEMVNLAGGMDAAGRAGEKSRILAWEEARAAGPEVIALIPCGFAPERIARELRSLERLPGWAALPAVRSGRVYVTDASAYFSRPGPRLVDGLEILAHFLHPEIFAMPDLPGAGGPLSQAARTED